MVWEKHLLFIKRKHPAEQILDGLLRFRSVIAILFFIFLVAFELSGSSISVYQDCYLEPAGVKEYTIFGSPRPIRSDEWAVNTPMALSQYRNKTGKFPYFSDTIRGTQTDTFIIYGQPVLDIAVIFRPFHWGYLFLSPGRGLSFFWFGRFIALFLVTLELGMLITKNNKLLSVITAFLVTLAPTTQWWFAVNGLIEMLVFGQSAVLLIYHYMHTNKAWQRCLYAFLFTICAGGYILTFYPAWQIPLFYIFLALAVWIFISNYHKGVFSRKDFIPLLIFAVIFGSGMAYILTRSFSTIMTAVNTAYPGDRFETGGGMFTRFFQYIGNIFFPYNEAGIPGNACEQAVFFDFFPLGLIFAVLTLVKQKKKDVLLISLLSVTIFLSLYCMVSWPEWLAKITLLSNSPARRVHAVLGLANILLLVRTLSFGKIRFKLPVAIAAAGIYSVIIVLVSRLAYGEYFRKRDMTASLIILLGLSILLLIRQNKKVQSILAAGCICLSLVMGATVNPIEKGVGALLEQPIVKEIQKVAGKNDGLWIMDDLGLALNNIAIVVGAPTINSTNVYPYLERWETFDEVGEYTELYNRYAHITFRLKNESETNYEYLAEDHFIINLNVNDLYKLKATYIVTRNDLTALNNDEVNFSFISSAQELNIYKVLYDH